MNPPPSAEGEGVPPLSERRKNLYDAKIVLGVLAPFYLSPVLFFGTLMSQCAYTVLVVAVMTLLEALPLPVVALIPILASSFIEPPDSELNTTNYLPNIEIISMIGLLAVYVSVDSTHLWTRVSLLLLRWQGPRLQRLFILVMVFTFCVSLFLPSGFVTLLLAALISRTVHNIQDELVASLQEKARRRQMSFKGRAPSEDLFRRLSKQLKSGTASPVSKGMGLTPRRATMGGKAKAHRIEVAELALSPGLSPSLNRMKDVATNLATSLFDLRRKSSGATSSQFTTTPLRVREVGPSRLPSNQTLSKSGPLISPSTSGLITGASTPAVKGTRQQKRLTSPDSSFVNEPDASKQLMVFHCTSMGPGRDVGWSDPGCRDERLTSPYKQAKGMYKTIEKVLIVSVAYTAIVAEQCRFGKTASKDVIDGHFARIGEPSPLSTTSYLACAFPASLVSAVIFWVYMYRVYLRKMDVNIDREHYKAIREIFIEKWKTTGRISMKEMFGVFMVTTVTLSIVTNFKTNLGIDTITLSYTFLLICVGIPRELGNPIMADSRVSWSWLMRCMPWDMVLVRMGGVALAEIIRLSELSSWFYGEILAHNLKNVSPFWSQALLLGVTAVVSELDSTHLGVQSVASMIYLARRPNTPQLYFALPVVLESHYVLLLPYTRVTLIFVHQYSQIEWSELLRLVFILKTVSCVVLLFFSNTVCFIGPLKNMTNRISTNTSPVSRLAPHQLSF